MSTPLNDAQRAAVERWGQDVCVVAGPGSGKTRVLIERFRWLVEAKGVDPGRILAVTFTEKAATEIKKRLIGAFAASESLRERIERAWVSTIHGFCTRLLKEHAIAANLDPDFTLVEEARSRIVQIRAAEAVLDELLRRHPAPMRRLLAGLDTGGAEIAEGLLDLYEEARTAGIPIESFRAPAPPDCDGWKEISAAARVILSEPPFGTDLQKRAHHAAHAWARSVLELPAAASWKQRLECLDAAPRPSSLSSKARSRGVAQELKDALGPQAAARAALAEYFPVYPLFFEALSGLHQKYSAWKHERGLLDFHDLEECAVALLESDAALRSRIRSNFDQVLMDELQDTNRLQWRLIDLVRSPNNLFAVGDINQSIYYFRHADPGVFRQYREALASTGAVIDELRENYRSRAPIIEAVNRTAPHLLGGVEPHRLEARREYAPKDEPSIEFTYTFPAQEGDDPAWIEARWIARRIRELTGALSIGKPGEERAARFSDIAVLARTISALAPVQQALDEFGVPSVVSGGRSFYEAREVRDLVAWLRVLANPLDEISLATVLRSPLVGAGDETLLRLKWAGPLVDSIPAYDAAQPDAERLAWFWNTVTSQRARLDAASPDTFLAEALDASSYEEALPARARANIAKLLAALRERWRRDRASVAEIAAELDLWRTVESEAEAATEEVTNCVRLMSVHAAKGLEFPIVFLASMRSAGQNRRPVFCFNAGHVIGACWRHPAGGKAIPDPTHLAVYSGKKQQEDGEEDRLLYVALTRAEEHLVCSTSTQGQGDWAKRVCEGLGLPTGNPKNPREEHIGAVRLLHTSTPAATDGLAALTAAGTEPLRLLERPTLDGQHDTTLPVTSVAQYSFCPRQYYLARFLGWSRPPATPSIGLPAQEPTEFSASEFGTHVHELLAGKPWPEAPAEALTMKHAFEQSILGRRAARATRREYEFDFLADVEGAILRGQIDLWFEDQGELILVDYKTDQVEPGSEPRHARRYAPQLRLYALALEKLTGRTPARAVLWYLRTSTPVAISIDAEALESARAAIRGLLEAQASIRFPLREGTHCLRCSYYRSGCPAVVPEESAKAATAQAEE